MDREKDIQTICEQVLEVNLEVNQNTWYGTCPFCSSGGYVDYMSEVKHDQNCAYLIAKDLLTK